MFLPRAPRRAVPWLSLYAMPCHARTPALDTRFSRARPDLRALDRLQRSFSSEHLHSTGLCSRSGAFLPHALLVVHAYMCEIPRKKRTNERAREGRRGRIPRTRGLQVASSRRLREPRRRNDFRPRFSRFSAPRAPTPSQTKVGRLVLVWDRRETEGNETRTTDRDGMLMAYPTEKDIL